MKKDLLSGLNEMQKEAVCHGTGPLLILAGAGSGKTRVITHRIAYLIQNGVSPYHIMAITFTNKAAEEMKERVVGILQDEHSSVFVSTFHSACVRFLRRDIERLGYAKDFTIYDTTDSKSLIKTCVKNLDLDPKIYKDRAVLSEISARKNGMKSSLEEAFFNPLTEYERNLELIYYEYQKRLKQNNALDFDDLILKMVELLSNYEDIREYYHRRFQYIMVDEYQDTNNSQFELVRLLSEGHRNLCVVGDDDQSIYKFRGANIENILNFEKHYPESKVIKLEQNYRSTSQILSVANAVIANNTYRKDKRLWTDNHSGSKAEQWEFETGYNEAEFVIRQIRDLVTTEGLNYRDFAILYRANFQSRLFEEKAVFYNIPYRLVGGVNFYARAEIKDILAYLRILLNPNDAVSLQRIINTPKRGIGNTTIAKLVAFSEEQDISLYKAMSRVNELSSISAKTVKAVSDFISLIDGISKEAESLGVKDIMELVYEKSGYMADLSIENTDEALSRAENIGEFISKAADYDNRNDTGGLSGFLQEVSLIADIDTLDSDDYVVMMTIHGSKGLEFDRVYLTGMEEELFPSHFATQNDDEGALEEERRLCYVGITRARKVLTFTLANQRIVGGKFVRTEPSRFLDEIPSDLIEIKGPVRHAPVFEQRETFFKSDRDYKEPVIASLGSERRKGTERKTYVGGGASAGKGFKPDFNGLSKLMQEERIKKASLVKEIPSYVVGDRVKHIKYGVGTVSEITDAGRDYQITVEFENGTSRILLAGFAKLLKMEE